MQGCMARPGNGTECEGRAGQTKSTSERGEPVRDARRPRVQPDKRKNDRRNGMNSSAWLYQPPAAHSSRLKSGAISDSSLSTSSSSAPPPRVRSYSSRSSSSPASPAPAGPGVLALLEPAPP